MCCWLNSHPDLFLDYWIIPYTRLRTFSPFILIGSAFDPPPRYFKQKELQLSLKDTSYWESLHGKRRYLNSTLLNYSYINFDILEFVSLTYTKTWSTTTIFELECKCGNIKNKALEIKRVWHLKKKSDNLINQIPCWIRS